MTLQELRQRQNWSLTQKIDHSLGAISEYINRLDGNVYVSFSGGKDSTVLLHLCEIVKPGVQCLFINTGCEDPYILQFIRYMSVSHNITTIRPTLTPRQVWERYGFPLVSKEQAENIHSIRVNPNSIKSKKALGIINPDSAFVLSHKWRYLITETYDTSNQCCDVLKKRPAKKFQKETGLKPIIGTLASESLLREKTYLRRGGCNVFGDNACSLPLSIWNDEDIWQFINERRVPIAECYRKGVKRTGCVACGFGCQYAGDNRFRYLYSEHPRYYKMVMSFKNNGITYRQAIRRVLAVNGLFLPDEELSLF